MHALSFRVAVMGMYTTNYQTRMDTQVRPRRHQQHALSSSISFHRSVVYTVSL
jgi:hypothetical protein